MIRKLDMRELVYYVAVSIDGFIAAPDGDPSAFPVEGDHSATLISEFGDALPAHVLRAIGMDAPRTRFDTVVMGWNSYTPALDVGIDSPYAHLHQVVASRQQRTVPEEITLTADPVATIRELKAQDGLGIYLCGGGQLAGALIGEIDRLILKRYSVALGDGIPLFGGVSTGPVGFDLVADRPLGSVGHIEEYVRRA